VEYVVIRHGSYGSHNPVRKGGSGEGEEKPKSRAVVIEYGGLYFFLTMSEVKLFCLVTTPPGGTTMGQPVRSIVVFFLWDLSHTVWDRHLIKICHHKIRPGRIHCQL
jgi:hypothetical protein